MTALEKQKTIAVVGAGTMGIGIAQVAAAAGHPVLLYDLSEAVVVKGLEKIASGLERQVERKRMTLQDKESLLKNIRICNDLEKLAAASLVIEAIVEDISVKQKLFADLEEICDLNCIFATNTSSISVTAIGCVLDAPGRLLGMHFFNPAPIMKLVEIISGLATEPSIAEVIFDTAENWGKTAVHARNTPGFIVNRVARPFYAESLRLLQEGAADVSTIDAIVRDAGGFRMGPFELMDLIGQDINYAVTCSVHRAFYGDPRFTPSLLQQELVDGGFLGRKSGHGFYYYGDSPTPLEARNYDACTPPDQLSFVGESYCSELLNDMIEEAGIRIEQESGEVFSIVGDNFTLCQTDGRMATLRAAQDDVENLVLFDLALDYKLTNRIAICSADNTDPAALESVCGLFQALGKQVNLLDDVAGLCVMRTVCMLINEAADAVNQRVCSVSAVDTAMKAGLNYPLGPFAWADLISIDLVLQVLDNLVDNYGEDRYRASPLLIRKLAAARNFYD
ncbi:MAG: 3-hydroxybutyryl-CoA dehydrogenase [Gammaproteobacteria bacterium]|jgi:3-hydroxybutyryl-CoA dehydrogenase